MRDPPDDSPPEYDGSEPKVPPSASNSVATPTTHNIIIFGSSGSGKSSIVNLLAGGDVALTGNGAKGCTFQNKAYPISIGQHHFTLYDTAGLDEGEAGRVPAYQAISQLHDLLLVDLKGAGVALLIFCVRAGRITETAGHNWRLFSEVICQGQVPVLLAITGLETEEGEMSDWWKRDENRLTFEQYGVRAGGVVCMTAYRGKEKKGAHPFQEEYDLSRSLLQEEILVRRLLMPWAPEPVEWFKTVVDETVEGGCWPFEPPKTITTVRMIAGEGLKRLQSIYKFGEAEKEAFLSRLLKKVISLTGVDDS